MILQIGNRCSGQIPAGSSKGEGNRWQDSRDGNFHVNPDGTLSGVTAQAVEENP